MPEMDKEALKEAVFAVLVDMGFAAQDEADPIEPEEDDGPDSIFSGASDAVNEIAEALTVIDWTLADTGDKMNEPELYRLMAKVIGHGINLEAGWVAGSEQSWRYTADAYKTRATELEAAGDLHECDIPVMDRGKYGLTERVVSALGLVLTSVAMSKTSNEADDDLGEENEPLNVGECIQLCWVLLGRLESLSHAGWWPIPFGADSPFKIVMTELNNQRKALGEGVWGPIHLPTGTQPWSWGGQNG